MEILKYKFNLSVAKFLGRNESNTQDMKNIRNVMCWPSKTFNIFNNIREIPFLRSSVSNK